MKVFVTGATGHVGFHVALAFRRAGHHVLGLTRSEKGGARLDRHEIRPVIGSLQDPGSWKGAEDAAAPKTVVYTSGVWVYGQTGDGVADETTPLAPLPMSLSRVETEKRVLSAAGVKGIVMRPGSVYGYGGSLTGMWFEGAAKG